MSIHHFSMWTHKALEKRLGQNAVNGLGMGVCFHDVRRPLSEWQVSSRLSDWRNADEALRVIDEELRRWNIADDYGLSVSGILCVREL